MKTFIAPALISLATVSSVAFAETKTNVAEKSTAIQFMNDNQMHQVEGAVSRKEYFSRLGKAAKARKKAIEAARRGRVSKDIYHE